MSPSDDRLSSDTGRTRKALAPLLAWYDRTSRDLPWRRTRDPYAIWVSEIMLQQTTVKTVLRYYERFMERFPTVEDLARAELALVLKSWEGLGYYQRARNLHRAAGIVAHDPGPPRWPQSVEEWQRLPGIGRSTAGAIHSISTDRWAPILDANVRRVTGRFFGIPSGTKGELNRLWEASDGWGEDNPRPGDTNQALMELGAVLCLPASPACGECPVASFCQTIECGREERVASPGEPAFFPLQEPLGSSSGRRMKKSPASTRKRVALVPASGPLLFEPRGEGRLLEGLLEVAGFPSAGLSPGETVAEGFFSGWRVVEELFSVRHVYSHFREEVQVLRVIPAEGKEREAIAGEKSITEGWATLSASEGLALTGVARKIVRKLRSQEDPDVLTEIRDPPPAPEGA
ncbi:MAG: A/G-specific adenine glycosylase [Nitrospirae bacterium]|jgi:A/G-specific adenine glycosylase|nr:A/G-specific adenine glycosylase [Nitrospirota bacterium]